MVDVVIPIPYTAPSSTTNTRITANTSTAYTVDPANAGYFDLTLTANCTITASATLTAAQEKEVFLRIIQDGTGSRTLSWSGVTWDAGVAPTMLTAAGTGISVTLVYTSSEIRGFYSLSSLDTANFAGLLLLGTAGTTVQTIESTATNDNPQEVVVQNRVTTTDATVTVLHTFTIPVTTSFLIDAKVVARRTGGGAGTAEDGAGYSIFGLFKNVAGTATAIGTADVVAKESQAAWDIGFNATAGTVQLRVTGAAANNVTWHMTARTYQVST